MNESDLPYFDFRDQLAADLRAGACASDPASMLRRVQLCTGHDPAKAAEWTERFRADLARHIEHAGRAHVSKPDGIAR